MMKNVGFFLAVLGTTSYVFPLIGRRSMIMSVFGEYEKFAAPAAIVAGCILLAIGFAKKKPEEKKAA